MRNHKKAVTKHYKLIMRPLSEATSRISRKTFTRKFIALGRLLDQWDEVMGAQFASLAQPVKLNYRKKGRGQKESYAILDVQPQQPTRRS